MLLVLEKAVRREEKEVHRSRTLLDRFIFWTVKISKREIVSDLERTLVRDCRDNI